MSSTAGAPSNEAQIDYWNTAAGPTWVAHQAQLDRQLEVLGLEAMRIVEEGIADVDDVNRACVLAFNHRMGPLDTMDLTGLDTALHVATAMTEQYGERFLAPQNIRALVAAGHLGRKTGRGFTDHSAG